MIHYRNWFRSKLASQTKLVRMVKAKYYGAGTFYIVQMLPIMEYIICPYHLPTNASCRANEAS